MSQSGSMYTRLVRLIMGLLAVVGVNLFLIFGLLGFSKIENYTLPFGQHLLYNHDSGFSISQSENNSFHYVISPHVDSMVVQGISTKIMDREDSISTDRSHSILHDYWRSIAWYFGRSLHELAGITPYGDLSYTAAVVDDELVISKTIDFDSQIQLLDFKHTLQLSSEDEVTLHGDGDQINISSISVRNPHMSGRLVVYAQPGQFIVYDNSRQTIDILDKGVASASSQRTYKLVIKSDF